MINFNRIFKMLFICTGLLLSSCSTKYDVVIAGGTVYDGLGGEPYVANVGINDGRIVKIGDFKPNS